MLMPHNSACRDPSTENAPMIDRSMRSRRALALTAAVAGGLIDVAYLRQIADQATGIDARVAFVAGYIGLAAGLALVGAIRMGRDDPLAHAALLGSATGFIGIGVVGLFSIGLSLLIAGVVAAFTVDPRRVGASVAVGVIVCALAILAVGLAATFAVGRAV